eukprot:CAMPEP_0119123466 /NCGR_PEP_ID=MMETSP1310-20130426/3410_1 /TAXON_ID=464262 /ORGANISM="Genus nov. species nov., Strain RCC2339" /LENGTH=707 /DNA_ID=CAMNT_0007113297 /DNA_START=40 /DNA_END=2163 /DNA_ORIENTATION=+
MTWRLICVISLFAAVGWGSEIRAADLSDTEVESYGGTNVVVNCHMYNTENMYGWEKELMRDCPRSALGILHFNTSAKSSDSEAHFILGLKALHNFWYDMCKIEFESAIEKEPLLGIAYWGRALCEAQLLWNSENVKESSAWLDLARDRDAYPGYMDPREVQYFNSVVTLNTVPSGQTPLDSRPERYQNYLDSLTALAAQYPNDWTAQSFTALMTLAVGSVGECASAFTASCLAQQDAARVAVDAAFRENPFFAGVLHYGMHAHDFPNQTAYDSGLKYAMAYPYLVNSTCHSLHMPSHIYDRTGDFVRGGQSNEESVAGADQFATSGALSMDGGTINMSYGLEFAFNAGNLYHSLEFQQYEYLQQCRMPLARRMLGRMRFASNQAVERLAVANGRPVNSIDPQSTFEENFGSSWYDATTYKQWEYRMFARQVQFSLMLTLMNNTLDAVGQADWHSALMASYPLRLSWAKEETTVYNHGVYSPQSEAGLWNAMALAQLYDYRITSSQIPVNQVPRDFHDRICGSYPATMTTLPSGCIPEGVVAAKERLFEVALSYKNQTLKYEESLTLALLMQVQAMEEFNLGDIERARLLAKTGAELEREASRSILPTSTTLYFIPGDAFYGWILLASATPTETAVNQAAEDAFASCLSPLIRPNNSLCLLGHARASARLGHVEAARIAYTALLSLWKEDSNCGEARTEAQNYVADEF